MEESQISKNQGDAPGVVPSLPAATSQVKKRGRPRKASAAAANVLTEKRRRGRPRLSAPMVRPSRFEMIKTILPGEKKRIQAVLSLASWDKLKKISVALGKNISGSVASCVACYHSARQRTDGKN